MESSIAAGSPVQAGEEVSLTEQLQSFMRGDRASTEALLGEVMPRLRDIAARALKRERYVTPLRTTELIDELWLSQLSKRGWEINDRGHFYALASIAMRRILVEMARKRLAVRRGGGEETIALADCGTLPGTDLKAFERVIEIGILMDRLDAELPDVARIIDMHYFAGFTLEEIAAETGLTPKQVRRRWERGKAWLREALRPRKGR